MIDLVVVADVGSCVDDVDVTSIAVHDVDIEVVVAGFRLLFVLLSQFLQPLQLHLL